MKPKNPMGQENLFTEQLIWTKTVKYGIIAVVLRSAEMRKPYLNEREKEPVPKLDKFLSGKANQLFRGQNNGYIQTQLQSLRSENRETIQPRDSRLERKKSQPKESSSSSRSGVRKKAKRGSDTQALTDFERFKAEYAKKKQRLHEKITDDKNSDDEAQTSHGRGKFFPLMKKIRSTVMYKPFLSKRKEIPVPKLNESLLRMAEVTDAVSCRAAYERHFNFWVNGSSLKYNSKLGRWATRQLWLCSGNSLKIAILDDNVNYMERVFRQLTPETKWDANLMFYESLRLAYLLGAENVANLINRKMLRIYGEKELLDSETIFSSIGASGNFDWLKREIIVQNLTQMPGSAYEHVNTAGLHALIRIAKDLFDWDPPTVTL